MSKASITALAVLLLLVPGSVFCRESAGAVLITPEKVYSLMKEGSGMWLVDVRGPADYGRCHMEMALNIPLEEMRVKNLPKDKLVVLVDDSLGNTRAVDAASLLNSKGVKKVCVLDGGLYGWGRSGYPLAGMASTSNPVTADELKAALNSGLPVKVYDLSGDGGKSSGIPGSEVVAGADLNARLKNLSSIIAKSAGKGLAARLKGLPQIVLVFSAGDDAAGATRRISLLGSADVRYLLGGYEAMKVISGMVVSTSSGDCPVCPKSREGRASR